MKPDETRCVRCGALFTIMMPPSDHPDGEQHCTEQGCDASWFPGHDDRRHIPPRERYKVPQ